MSLNDASYTHLHNAQIIKYCSKLLRKSRPFEHLFHLGPVIIKITQIWPDQARSPGNGPPGAGSLPPKMRLEMFFKK
jgi:hypothetical protein